MRTWFITGATGGIGGALTERLLDRGERVAAVARRIEKLDALAAAHGDRLWRAVLDVTDPGGIRETVDEAISALGSIDVVASCAGYALFGAAEELRDEDVERQIATNLLGSIRLIRAFLPHFRAREEGRIVQLSSEAGQMTYPGLSLYHATKWGIEGFCDSLAAEVASFNVHVTLVEPGRVATDFDANAVMAAPKLETYRKGPVGMLLSLLSLGKMPPVSDPVRLADAIIAASEQEMPPRRLTLGSDGYRNIHRALSRRLSELEAQKEIAASTDLS